MDARGSRMQGTNFPSAVLRRMFRRIARVLVTRLSERGDCEYFVIFLSLLFPRSTDGPGQPTSCNEAFAMSIAHVACTYR